MLLLTIYDEAHRIPQHKIEVFGGLPGVRTGKPVPAVATCLPLPASAEDRYQGHPREEVVSMSPEVQAEYDRILAAVAVRSGALMAPRGDRQYGWIAGDWSHLSQCGVKSWGSAVETTFTQFEGTFAEGTRYRTAIDVADVVCNCGEITGREVRWEPSEGLGEVTSAVFEALYRELRGDVS